MLIYKIVDHAAWRSAESDGVFKGAPIDIADGFIHFSTAEQAVETAAKHFASQKDLLLVAFEADAMGEALKWEPSRGGALFPHLYRELRTDEAAWSADLPLSEDGAHQFPEAMT